MINFIEKIINIIYDMIYDILDKIIKYIKSLFKSRKHYESIYVSNDFMNASVNNISCTKVDNS